MESAVTLPPAVRAAVAEATARLRAIYGDRLDRVVLYGSYARGDARPDSDVDLLVVLRGEYDAYWELKRHLSPLGFAMFRDHGVNVSLQPFDTDELADDARPLMANVRDEGAVL